jgi:hypothetical protein
MTIFSSDVESQSVHDAYAEGIRHLSGEGALHSTLAVLATRFQSHGIDYVVIGAMALNKHGLKRVTKNIDLVLTTEGLANFGKHLLGRGGFGLEGYDQVFPGSSKRLRTYPGGVNIQVMLTGEYPGDGKPKPVSIPDPSSASTEIDGVRFVTFEKLIELKLASGMSAPHRLKDLADVQELIKIRGLQPEFAERLDPYVRDKFVELAETVKHSPKDED